MAVRFESVRFGSVEIAEDELIDFPLGLVGLPGRGYALLDRNPGTDFRWLHSTEDAALALPVVPPSAFFADFELRVGSEELEASGIADLAAASVYVTVRAAPDPREITANLRAPIVICEGRGFQLLNTIESAALRAPLFEFAPAPARSADAA